MPILQQSVHGEEPFEPSHLNGTHEGEDSLSSHRLHLRFPTQRPLSCAHPFTPSELRSRVCESAAEWNQGCADRVLQQQLPAGLRSRQRKPIEAQL